jgi:hypothetical protein
MDKENTGHIDLTCERGFCAVQEMALWEYVGEGILVMPRLWKAHMYGQSLSLTSPERHMAHRL